VRFLTKVKGRRILGFEWENECGESGAEVDRLREGGLELELRHKTRTTLIFMFVPWIKCQSAFYFSTMMHTIIKSQEY
jgi:hypothetical protein